MYARHLIPRPEAQVTEHRAPIALPRDDAFFHGWGPKL